MSWPVYASTLRTSSLQVTPDSVLHTQDEGCGRLAVDTSSYPEPKTLNSKPWCRQAQEDSNKALMGLEASRREAGRLQQELSAAQSHIKDRQAAYSQLESRASEKQDRLQKLQQKLQQQARPDTSATTGCTALLAGELWSMPAWCRILRDGAELDCSILRRQMFVLRGVHGRISMRVLLSAFMPI